ncbi:MAG TPA: glutathionylspermidine synthase family protein [Caulobacteraceae bacterium]|nr:glutathionylspermidine synthase family protein [Caulobacteraceae bacterium]
MQRVPLPPRRDWRDKVEALGLAWHTAGGEPYWNEAAYYRFTAREIDEIEAASAELYRLCVIAGDHIVDNGLLGRCGVPEPAWDLVREAWAAEPPALNHGRFDLGYDGRSPPKLFEFNCDTPTALLEAAVVQWDWKEEVAPDLDQFNGLHDALVARWREIAPRLPGPRVCFAHFADAAGEDTVTTAYLRDTARLAGLDTGQILMGDIGWREADRRFVDLDGRPIDTLFHLYPWEWLLAEPFGAHVGDCGGMAWIEPVWKLVWSSKALLPILWELFPGHPNLLPASFEPLAGDHVKKPLFGREGANVEVVRGGRTVASNAGPYGAAGFVWQGLYRLPDFDGAHPVIGSWVVDGAPVGIGVREGSLITGNTARFAPHAFEPR